MYDLILELNSSKKSYNIVEAILRTLDIDLNLYPIEDIKNNVHIFRKKMGNELITKNIYKTLEYNLKIEKNEINSILINNKYIDENTTKYISYYINLNIIIINNNKYRYINKYNNILQTIILIEKDKKFIPVYLVEDNNIINVFCDNDIINILKYFTIDNSIIFNNKIELSDKDYKQINKLKNSTLKNLQVHCNNYNINIYKYIDTKKLYKKKSELFEELKFKLINK